MIPFWDKSVTLSMLIDLLTSTCRSTQVKIASTDLWPQEMFTFSEMLALVESESSFGAYVCHRRPGGSKLPKRPAILFSLAWPSASLLMDEFRLPDAILVSCWSLTTTRSCEHTPLFGGEESRFNLFSELNLNLFRIEPVWTCFALNLFEPVSHRKNGVGRPNKIMRNSSCEPLLFCRLMTKRKTLISVTSGMTCQVGLPIVAPFDELPFDVDGKKRSG